MLDQDVTGIVFNIQKFSVHDGKGIRTLVFLKGCPLSCLWCSNPESQRLTPERAFNPTRCLSAAVCGRCLSACTQGGITCRDGLLCNDRAKCVECFSCTHACPSGAQSVYGESVSVDTVLRRVEEDSVFYARSGGGLTLSGGEATMQPEFCLALLREARHRRVDTALETSGHCRWEVLEEAARHLNGIIYDLKCADSAKHKKFTGVGNERILDNFAKLCQQFPHLPIRVRTPVIPGFNDSEEDILRIKALIPQRHNVEYELLPYHRMGQPKYEYIGKTYAFAEAKLDDALMARLVALVKQ